MGQRKDYRDDLVFNEVEKWNEWRAEIFGLRDLDILLFGEVQDEVDIIKTRVAMKNYISNGVSLEEKKSIIKRIGFIPNAQAEKVFRILNKSRTGDGIKNLRILGESDHGKSWAMKYYTGINNLKKTGKLYVGPVLFLDVKSGRNLGPTLKTGCALLGYPITATDYDQLLQRFIKAVRKEGVQMIILDEVGNINSSEKMNQLKSLDNDLLRPIVAVSAEGQFFGANDQMAQRFRPEYTFNKYSGDELLEILRIIEAYLPFEDSSHLDLWTVPGIDGHQFEGLRQHIYNLTNGQISLVLKLVKKAANIALDKGATFISVEHIPDAAKELMFS